MSEHKVGELVMGRPREGKLTLGTIHSKYIGGQGFNAREYFVIEWQRIGWAKGIELSGYTATDIDEMKQLLKRYMESCESVEVRSF